ncbi:hypothetical protein [Nocardioides sp.]|uniref:hypothetical protein n=1 Tax=Nocardioides sp. TaxID=35761 RepID=UPI00262F7F20|nr:hypothetical protein [Nocardioides sp.]
MAATTPAATTTVQLGLAVGGLLRTWSAEGTRLWHMDNDGILAAVQGTGMLTRVERGPGRFREVAELDESDPASPALVLPSGSRVRLSPVSGSVSPRAEAPQEFVRAINQALRHVAETFEFLVVELGGTDAPDVPYAFFALHVDEEGRQLSTVEVCPPPAQSDLWSEHLTPGSDVVSISAPASAGALDMAPYYLADAVPGWGILPWDIALTFGVRDQKS